MNASNITKVRNGNPAKQGLKLVLVLLLCVSLRLVRNGNPAKQGLKLFRVGLCRLIVCRVRNGNPAKQGLKLSKMLLESGTDTMSETEIQQNKD